jgi:hypothetical protein
MSLAVYERPTTYNSSVTTDDSRAIALERLGQLRDCLAQGADDDGLSGFVEQTAQLARSVETFHMEAIRFRLFGLRRQLTTHAGVPPAAAGLLEEVSQALEAAGFLIK